MISRRRRGNVQGRRQRAYWRGAVAWVAAMAMWVGADHAQAVVQVLPDMVLKRDAKTVTAPKAIRNDAVVKEIVAAFERAEQALQHQDRAGLMQFYSSEYNYHGLHVQDVERIWGEVFDHYRDLSSTHLFSAVTVLESPEGLRVEVTCTGGLYGAEASSGTRLTLDSWFQEVHFLVRTDQGWRFLGNRGGVPHAAPFSSSPHHPLF